MSGADGTLSHMRNIATPSRLGKTIGKQVLGFDFELFRWLAYVEAKVVEAILDPNERYIIVNVPPRCGKTVFSGIFLPSWFLGMYPSKRVMFVSYADDYSVKYGRAVRTILDRFGRKLFDVGVDKSAQSASDWQMAGSLGGMLSTGVGGVLTGYGGDLIIVDDIIKNIQEARSQAVKRMHEDWFDTTLMTRLEPGGTVIITATRWADDDVSGVLLDRMSKPEYDGPKWELIDMPALAEPRNINEMSDFELEEWVDEIGRRYGESLNPERRSAEGYRKIRDSGLDAYLWSCLYQQRPVASTSGMFPEKNWQHWNEANLPALTRKVRVWDLATTEGAGDFTVGTLIGVAASGDIYVIDRFRDQIGTATVEETVKTTAQRDGWGVPVLIEQEKNGAGKATVEHYQRLLPGYQVKPAKLEGSKEQRATPYSMMQQAKRVWLPAHAGWLKEWKKEHAGMIGNGVRPRHDDQIDTGAHGVLELLGVGSTEMWVPGLDDALVPEERQMDALFGEANPLADPEVVGSPHRHFHPPHLRALWDQDNELGPEDRHGAVDPPVLVGPVGDAPRRVQRSGFATSDSSAA